MLRQYIGELLDGIGLVTIGNEQRVLGLHDDQVIHAEQRDAAFGARIEDDVVFRIDLSEFAV